MDKSKVCEKMVECLRELSDLVSYMYMYSICINIFVFVFNKIHSSLHIFLE